MPPTGTSPEICAEVGDALSDGSLKLAEPVAELNPLDDLGKAVLNRPGFPRGLFVQNSGGFFKSIHLCMEFVLQFLRRPMAIGAV